MTVYFLNHTSNELILNLGENEIKIAKNEKIHIKSDTDTMLFSCYSVSCSSLKRSSRFKSVIVKYDFILNCLYKIILNRDCIEINLEEKSVEGRHSETYRFIDLQCDNITIVEKHYNVKDENEIRPKALPCKTIVILEKIMKIVDVLQTIIYVGVPTAILFFGLWYFTNIRIAIIVTIPIVAIGLITGIILRTFIMNMNKKIESKLGYTKKDLYVDRNSYYDSDYIFNVVT